MDPNEALRIIRKNLEKYLDTCDACVHGGCEEAHAAAEAMAGLDDWLSNGGFYPRDWCAGRGDRECK